MSRKIPGRTSAFLLLFLLSAFPLGLPVSYAAETPVDLSKFSISLKTSKEITSRVGQVSTKAVVGEDGRFCSYIYVLDISASELEKLKENPIENFEYLVGSGTEFKDVKVNGFAVIKNLCEGQKKSQTFKNRKAIPKELGWQQPIKSGTYIYVAALGYSNDPKLSKFAVPARIVAVSDFYKVKIKI